MFLTIITDEDQQSLEEDFDIITIRDHRYKKGNEDILVIYDFMQKAIKFKVRISFLLIG